MLNLYTGRIDFDKKQQDQILKQLKKGTEDLVRFKGMQDAQEIGKQVVEITEDYLNLKRELESMSDQCLQKCLDACIVDQCFQIAQVFRYEKVSRSKKSNIV